MFGEWKAEHIGGLVVVQELAIEPPDGRIVDEGEADLGIADALATEHGTTYLPNPCAIHRHTFLRRGNADANHAASLLTVRLSKSSALRSASRAGSPTASSALVAASRSLNFGLPNCSMSWSIFCL